MIISHTSPNAMYTKLYNDAGECITDKYCVLSYDTQTGDLFYLLRGIVNTEVLSTVMPGLRVEIGGPVNN